MEDIKTINSTGKIQTSKSSSVNSDLLSEIDKQDLQRASYEELIQMGIDVSEIKGYSQWILGKLGDAVASNENSKKGDLKDYALKIRQNYAVLSQYVYTYRKFNKEDPTFQPNKYYGSIPWGVLALVATKTDKPQKFIEQLQEQNKEVSLEVAYREIKRIASPDGKEPPKKPIIKLHWNNNSCLYKIEMDPQDFPQIDWMGLKDDLIEYLEVLR